ncbi:UsfY protein [Mycobacterium sp. 236(2023)]|uniref:UsfY protein n=1 Tax=Mycobacterium sp. 236(2023) TaxID=3038163 RepID=UPI002414DFD2|nr:UsfY protein [Mycobacterium sp. 236(2023)]MDG4667265.1 UsfY protein [Mycobacterium sp. 236(2023)]
MGDTHLDPIDHHRTTLPHSGATFKDAFLLPGIALLAISVVGIALGLASAGYMRGGWAALTIVAAALIALFGTFLIVRERRRVRRIERNHSAEQHVSQKLSRRPGVR